jgi:hypothetical protein
MKRALLGHPAVALVLDVALVVGFAAAGRATHAEANALLGVLGTAWPFLVGTGIGWVLVRVLRGAWPLELGPGITVWFATLVFGMVLRRLTGEGTAWPFVVVATLTLAVLLLGWRALAQALRSRYGAQPGHARTGPTHGAG